MKTVDLFRLAPALGLLAGLAVPPAGAASPAPHPCARIAAAAERLACFDRAFPAGGAQTAVPAPAAQGVMPGATSPGTTAAMAPAVAAPAPTGTETLTERFGLPAATPGPDSRLDAIEASVVSVERLPRGERLFRLSNGQRWTESGAQGRGHLVPGDVVRIERAAFGSFLLVTPARVGLRVRRLQ